MRALLGNISPVQTVREVVSEKEAEDKGLPVTNPLPGQRGVEVLVRSRVEGSDGVSVFTNNDPEGTPAGFVDDIVGCWLGYHSDDPPEWVASDSDQVSLLLQARFQTKDHKVAIRQLSEVEPEDES